MLSREDSGALRCTSTHMRLVAAETARQQLVQDMTYLEKVREGSGLSEATRDECQSKFESSEKGIRHFINQHWSTLNISAKVRPLGETMCLDQYPEIASTLHTCDIGQLRLLLTHDQKQIIGILEPGTDMVYVVGMPAEYNTRTLCSAYLLCKFVTGL